MESESEQLIRPGGVPRSDSLWAEEDAMDDGEDKSELLERAGVDGSGISADVVMESEVAAGKVARRDLAFGGVTGRELDWVMLAVSLFDDTLGAGCPHVE